jgi:serine/threonine protein kinase
MIIKAKYTLQDCISKEARNLLEQLLEKDPRKRLNVR